MEKVALYARVSTGEQSIDNQVERLEEWADYKEVDADLFKDDGVSALDDDRPGFEHMMNRVADGEYDAVVFERLDRVARSMFHLLDISRTLEEHETDMVVTEQSIDTSTPEGKLTFHVLGAIAEFEREITRARAKKGFEKAKEAGEVGRPKAELPTEEIVEQWEDGMPVTRLAEKHGVSRTTIYDRLKDAGAMNEGEP